MLDFNLIKGIYSLDSNDKSQSLSNKYNLPIIYEQPKSKGLYLYVSNRIGIYSDKYPKPFFPLYLPVKKEPIHQAIGKSTKILDVTTGWGVDADKLRQFNKDITLVEKNLLIHLILQDTLKFYGYEHSKLNFAESNQFLLGTTESFDAIYIDPMRNHSGKRANAKGISMIQEFAKVDQSWENLLNTAKQKANKVVLKTSCLKKIPKPSDVIKGKNTHFAIYLA